MEQPFVPFEGGDGLIAVMEAAASLVVMVDPCGRIGYVNSRAARALGYRPEDLLGRPVEILVPEASTARHVDDRERYLRAARARPMGIGLDLRARRRDGSHFSVEIALTPVEHVGGTWAIAGLVDVSARRAQAAAVTSPSRAYRTLARLNEAIVRATDVDHLYAETCRISVAEGGYLGAWVLRPSASGPVTVVASAGATEELAPRIALAADPDDVEGRGITARALREGRPVYSSDSRADDVTRPWHQLASDLDIRAAASIPLRREGAVVATLTLVSGQQGVFDQKTRTLLEGVADNVSFALEGFARSERLAQTARERAALLGRLVRAQKEERARIAADVHDDSVQGLAAVDLRLGLLQRRIEAASPDLTPEVQLLQTMVEEVMVGLRLLLFELEPADPEASLADLLRDAARNVFEGTRVRWSVDLGMAEDPTPHETALSPVTRAQAVRVVKEALINARKHADAHVVSIRLRTDHTGIEIAVSDDGVGLAEHWTTAPGHRGIATMRDRVETSGGWFRVESREVGTTVRFWVPGELDREGPEA